MSDVEMYGVEPYLFPDAMSGRISPSGEGLLFYADTSAQHDRATYDGLCGKACDRSATERYTRDMSHVEQMLECDVPGRYVEYDASGRVIKGEETKAHSRYDEDVYINNHTAVWGSFWRDGAWGYACCCSTVKQSYCVGSAGVEAEKAQVRRTG